MTKNAEILLDIINKSFCHPTAEEVRKLAQEAGNSMSMATVYNNLNSLCQEGKIRRLTIADQTDRYDKILRHDHLVCKKCGSIKDLNLTNLANVIEKEVGTDIKGYDLTVFTMCDNCK